MLALLGFCWLASGPGFTVGVRPSGQDRSAGTKLGLNTATWVDWLQVPGMSEATAWNLVNYRKQVGAFGSVDDLERVQGIGKKSLEKLRLFVKESSDPLRVLSDGPKPSEKFSTPLPKKIPTMAMNPNVASMEELEQLPGIGPKIAKKICETRGKEAFLKKEDLLTVPGIGKKTLEKISPYLVFPQTNQ